MSRQMPLKLAEVSTSIPEVRVNKARWHHSETEFAWLVALPGVQLPLDNVSSEAGC